MTLTPAPEVCLEDRSGQIRRAEIMDKNGRAVLRVDVPNQVGTNRYARVQFSPPGGTGNSGGYVPPIGNQPGNGGTVTPPVGTSIAGMAQSASAKIDFIRRQYANSIGYLIGSDGNPSFIGTQRPTGEQERFLSGLGALYSSLSNLRANAVNPNLVRSSAQRVQEDLSFTHSAWQQVRLDSDLNNRWSIARAEINTMLSSALR